MPQKVILGTFFDENSKKKKFYQILGRTLYFFKQNHDSYDFEHYEVTRISATICVSDSNYTDFVLNISANNDTEQHSLHRIRPLIKSDILCLIEWVHNIRRAKHYYLLRD